MEPVHPLMASYSSSYVGLHTPLSVRIARKAHAPVAFRGVAYERFPNTARAMPRDAYQLLLPQEMHAAERRENRPTEGWEVSRLDTREPLEMLRGLGLPVDGARLSRAAVVLFCKDQEQPPDFRQLLAIHRIIQTLRESGRLARVGPDKGGPWKVNE